MDGAEVVARVLYAAAVIAHPQHSFAVNDHAEHRRTCVNGLEREPSSADVVNIDAFRSGRYIDVSVVAGDGVDVASHSLPLSCTDIKAAEGVVEGGIDIESLFGTYPQLVVRSLIECVDVVVTGRIRKPATVIHLKRASVEAVETAARAEPHESCLVLKNTEDGIL